PAGGVRRSGGALPPLPGLGGGTLGFLTAYAVGYCLSPFGLKMPSLAPFSPHPLRAAREVILARCRGV
ncbi:MAG TPA: hypothetical protein VIN93_00265, partial [Bryobacteraceae bacterium]